MYFNQLPKIGLRNLKTALAVLLCLIIFPDEPFFACMTTIFCIQDTIPNSVAMGINRGYGTIHGGIIGLIFLFFCRLVTKYISIPFINTLCIYLLITIGISVVIYSCTLIKRHPSIPIACIVFLGITTAHAYSDPFYYAFNRTFKTLGGIVIGILVNRFVNPPTHKENTTQS